MVNNTEQHAVINEGSLQGAVARPQRGFADGALCFPSIPAQAAVLADTLVKYHPFEQGNKRTALASLQVFLARNDYLLMANEDEKVKFILDLARGQLSAEGAIQWVEERATKFDER